MIFDDVAGLLFAIIIGIESNKTILFSELDFYWNYGKFYNVKPGNYTLHLLYSGNELNQAKHIIAHNIIVEKIPLSGFIFSEFEDYYTENDNIIQTATIYPQANIYEPVTGKFSFQIFNAEDRSHEKTCETIENILNSEGYYEYTCVFPPLKEGFYYMRGCYSGDINYNEYCWTDDRSRFIVIDPRELD